MEFISIVCPAMRTIPEIIEAAGGSKTVGERVALKDGVRKWPEIGIPNRYWDALIAMCPDLTVDELHAANRVLRHDLQEAS